MRYPYLSSRELITLKYCLRRGDRKNMLKSSLYGSSIRDLQGP